MIKRGMVLVDEKTEEPVNVGDMRIGFRGVLYKVTGGEPPRHVGSTGRVYLDDGQGELYMYPSIVNCKWIPEKSA